MGKENKYGCDKALTGHATTPYPLAPRTGRCCGSLWVHMRKQTSCKQCYTVCPYYQVF
jgi:hypothetical protein